MDSIRYGWFSEFHETSPGECLSLEVEEVFYEGKTKYQDIKLFKRYVLKYIPRLIPE